ncbi:hypothetical protein C1646_764669 [Rhizophagus diaphanus]|nr:hypothetical protein C1646_764669 [Rhizophagus diaphanus] [Rhizophagus sp. MUCL 43196]
MDPGKVPQELQDLTDIEEMLIAQVFPIVSVYNLSGGQYAYHGNIINFSQDIQEFVMRLSRNPSTLDLVIIRCYTENRSNFRDFHDIEIDSDVLQTLSENDLIEMHLSQLIDEFNDRPNKQHLDQVDDENNEDNFILQTFVPLLSNKHSKKRAINEILNRMHNDHERAEGQLTVSEILDLMESDAHITDKVLRYGEELHGTCQYWLCHRAELLDMIKQMRSKGMIFFTFSAADTY